MAFVKRARFFLLRCINFLGLVFNNPFFDAPSLRSVHMLEAVSEGDDDPKNRNRG